VSSLSDYSFEDSSVSDLNENDSQRKLIKNVSDQIAVSVQHVSVNYKINFDRVPTVKNALSAFRKHEKGTKVVEALRDVSFDIPHGTVLGIVGHNGAGKSTLLRTVAGILAPTAGRIEVRGHISTLLALGLGFNGLLSGRENVMLGGLAAGMTKSEVNDIYNEIAKFAELGDFIDMPVRTYSSGMAARLAFSVGVHMDPDILLIDEALSAGDAQFKEKAAAKMHELMDNARTMLLVSHGLPTIKELCNDAIWLDHGRLMMRGDPTEVVDAYLESVNSAKQSSALNDF
jgi:ABC-type polysaccharide/polyol phosphate transport system ATPase subunit